MPALYTLWNTRLEKRWNIGSDDFVLPTILAISVRLVGFVLVVGVLVYLYVAPLGCDDLTLETPPWLYGTLFTTLLLEFAVVVNDAIIMSKSCRGRIDHSQEPQPEEAIPDFDLADGSTIRARRWPDPDGASPRKPLKRYLSLRFLLFILEIVLSGLYGYACWSPVITDQLLECDRFQGPVYFARAVAVTWWIVIVVSSIMWFIFLDPVGICTPGLLDQLDFLDEDEEVTDPTKYKVFKFHRSRIGSRRMKRRLKTIFCCCLGFTRHSERGLALEDAARVLQSIFNDVDLVGSDLVAGLILLNRHQKQKSGQNQCLVSDYRKLTFRQMSKRSDEELIPEGYDSTGQCLSEIPHPSLHKDLEGYILLDDLLHYCHYALGVYGWPLYIYNNLNCGTGCCGLTACCKLTAKTCFGCYCNRLSERKATGDIIADNLCFCGFASVQLLSPNPKLKEEDIKHITFENEYFECPYLLCVDHAMKAVVVCVRGTLSFKDVLTDITVSVKHLTKDNVGDRFNVKGAYVHRGMCRTAAGIRDQLLNPDKPILTNTLRQCNLYRLVIVGHSLGAGVASILAILLKDYFPDLICYAYSPPGCVFSFPLVQYSRDFITSVVIGNDMVPRLSIRALHYMKREIEALLKKCKKPKHQVIFQPRWCDRMCNLCTSEVEDPSVSMEEIEHKLSRDDGDEETDHMTLPPRPSLNRPDCILSWACCGKKNFNEDNKPPVKKVTRRQKIPTFAPGSILHLIVRHKQKPSCLGQCYVLKVTPEWMKSEDLGVVIADRGMIEDHMPTRVMEVLQTYHRELSCETSLVFTEDRVTSERKKMREEVTRNLIEKRNPFDALLRGRLDSDGRRPAGEEPRFGEGEDEPDGAVQKTDGENDEVFEEVDGATEETVEGASVGDGAGPRSPEAAHRLQRSTAIDIEEEDPDGCGGVIRSDGGGGPVEVEMTIEGYGEEGYTELAPMDASL